MNLKIDKDNDLRKFYNAMSKAIEKQHKKDQPSR